MHKFEKYEELRDFLALYRANAFEDFTDFEYKLLVLLETVRKDAARRFEDEF